MHKDSDYYLESWSIRALVALFTSGESGGFTDRINRIGEDKGRPGHECP